MQVLFFSWGVLTLFTKYCCPLHTYASFFFFEFSVHLLSTDWVSSVFARKELGVVTPVVTANHQIGTFQTIYFYGVHAYSLSLNSR